MAENILDPGTGTNPEGANGGDLLGNAQGAADKAAETQREWMKGLSEPLQKSKSLSKFTDVDNLAKSYVELESELGKRVRIPSQDASSDEWAKYYEKVGRPKSPDEYAINRGKADDTFVSEFKKAAFSAGLSSSQADLIFGSVVKVTENGQRSQMEAYTARMKEADMLLRKEYGPQYESKVADARKAYEVLFDEQLRGEIAESGLANNPRFVHVLAELGPQIRGDSFLQGAGNDGQKAPKDPLAWMDKKYGAGA